MNTSTESALLRLRKDEVRRLRRRGTTRSVSVFKGEVWLTLDGDRRDIILTEGESRDFDIDAEIVVQALAPSTLLLLAEARPEAATPTVRERLARRLGAYGLVLRHATAAAVKSRNDHGARA